MTDPQEPPAFPAAETGAPTESSLESQATQSRHKENRKVLALALGVALFMGIAHFTPLKAWITNIQTWKDYVDTLGWAAHAWFCLVCAGAVMIGIPRLPLCAVAGLVFGFGEGVLLSLAGSTAGSYGTFLLARGGARRAFLSRARRWPWLAGLLREPTLMRVFWVRQLMLPGMVLNVMLGVTRVNHRTFLAGTLLGYLPLNIAFSLVGSGLGKGSLAQTLVQLLAAMGVVNLAGWLVWRWVQRNRAAAQQ